MLYTPLIRLVPNLSCVPESSRFIVAAAAAAADAVRPYLSFMEYYLASESRYLNSCQSCIDFRVGVDGRLLCTHDVEFGTTSMLSHLGQ